MPGFEGELFAATFAVAVNGQGNGKVRSVPKAGTTLKKTSKGKKRGTGLPATWIAKTRRAAQCLLQISGDSLLQNRVAVDEIPVRRFVFCG